MEREFIPKIEKEAPKEKFFNLGDKVVVKRTSGELESDWIIKEIIKEKGKDYFRVEKEEIKKGEKIILSKRVTKENLIDWKIESLQNQKKQILGWGEITAEDRKLIEKFDKEIEQWKKEKK